MTPDWSNTHESSNLSGSFYKLVEVVLKFIYFLSGSEYINLCSKFGLWKKDT